MLMTLVGAGLMATSVVLLRAFRIPEGQVSERPEWVNIVVAVAFTTGVSVGFMVALKGAANFVNYAVAG